MRSEFYLYKSGGLLTSVHVYGGVNMSLSVLTAAVGTAEHTCMLLCCTARVKQYLSELSLLLDEPGGDLETGRMPHQLA